MATTDIIARLRLNAEQFSSEHGKQFAGLKANAASTASEIRSNFVSNFAEVQKMASRALQMPRTASGGLDLSAEIASLKASANAADARADAFIQMHQAAMRAAEGGDKHADQLRRDADAAMVSVRAEEEAARADRARIGSLEALQRELNQTSGAVEINTKAQQRNVAVSGQHRAAMQNLGAQATDFSVQVLSGQSAFMAFAQQAPQAGAALAGFGGKLGVVGAALTGPYGIAGTIALSALGILAGKMLAVGDATEEAVKKLREKTKQTEIDAQANRIWARSADGAIAATRELTAELETQLKTLRQVQEEKERGAQQRLSSLYNADDGYNVTKAELERARGNLAAARAAQRNAGNVSSVAGVVASGAVIAGERQVASLEGRLETLVSSINAAEANIRGLNIVGSERRVAARLDDTAEATDRYTAALERLRDERARGLISEKQFEDQLLAAQTRRDAALEEVRKRQAASRRSPTRDAETATPAAVIKLLRDALPGFDVTSVKGGRHVAGSDHYRGQAIDFVPKAGMGSMSKADIRAVFDRAGIPIRRNAGGAEQLFGPGDKDHNDHFHVAWEKGKLALDNYRASARDTSEAERELEQLQKERAAAVVALEEAYDPAVAAARRYREELARITELEQAGNLTWGEAGEFRARAIETEKNRRGTSWNNMARDVLGITGDPMAGMTTMQLGLGDEPERRKQEARDAADYFANTVRNAITDAADLLQIRLPRGLDRLLQPGGIEGQSAEVATGLVKSLQMSGVKISEASADRLAQQVGTVLANASYGQLGGSVFASITGGRENKAASAVGGVLGGELGKSVGPAIASAVGGTLGKTLGSAAGPLGAIAGGILGNVIGGFLKKTQTGSAGISVSNGSITAGKATGTSADQRAGATGLAGSVASGLESIARVLGAQVTGTTNVLIGTYKDQIRVNTAGTKLGGKGTSNSTSFATEEEAIRFAITDALRDGVLSGISAASQRILQAGGDLEKAITKAGLIESVPKSLKAMLDPVGAAVDELNRKFKETVDALKEGGATAEQMAQAQRLYDLQLDQVKTSTASAAQGLKDFLLELKIGGSSPLSLRDQEAAALAQLQPFLTQIDNGQMVDQGKYQSAAKAYLDIEKQLYGSTERFFASFSAVQASTAKAIAAAENVQPITPPVESPFAKATADSAAKTATGVQTGNEISAQHTDLLVKVVSAIEQLAASGGFVGDAFVGASRGFVSRAAA